MTVKTDYSRFDIHDELTAPQGSVKILEGVARSGEVTKFVGVLAGAPAALRAYTRMSHELRSATLPEGSRLRIALAIAERRGDSYSIAQHARRARLAGIGLDEISLARQFSSSDPREAAMLQFLESVFGGNGRPAAHLTEQAREWDWEDEQLLEAVAFVALNEFQSLIANAAALPQDQTDKTVLVQAA